MREKRLRYGVYFTAFIGIAVLITSCLPEPLDLKGLPVIKPQIVVSTQIIPDRSLVVLLTRTFGALDADQDSDPQELLAQIAVSDAFVTVTGPGSVDTLLNLGTGVYGGISIPFVAGQEYSLYVQSEELGEITATTRVEPQISFENIKAELFFNGFDDTLAQITHTIRDPAGPNWYMLNVQRIEQNDVAEDLLNPNAFMRLLEDEAFEGKEYTETFRVFPRDFETGDTIGVSLSNIGKDYYDFLKLRSENRFSFIEYLSEPVNYPTNVKGGKGFFNLYIPDVRFFTLE